MYDYFYGPQADQFSFIRIPTVLFSAEQFKSVSPEAKVLYGILLKRMDLSAKNGWFDDRGRFYIICTLEEIMETLNCADNKATKLMNELEEKCGLIERKRQGLGKPNLIYYLCDFKLEFFTELMEKLLSSKRICETTEKQGLQPPKGEISFCPLLRLFQWSRTVPLTL